MNKSLRLSLLAIENSIVEMINSGAAGDYPEIMEVIQTVHDIRSNSKNMSALAFDKIENADQFLLATDNGKSISVCGHSGDEFDLELAFGIINRAKTKVKKEMLYKLFLRVMDGDFDD